MIVTDVPWQQVIWPSTTRVGMGIALAKDQRWFVVARYAPPGNYVGLNALTGT